jgi:hypothetical protein
VGALTSPRNRGGIEETIKRVYDCDESEVLEEFRLSVEEALSCWRPARMKENFSIPDE